jgi:5-methylcytosine-specific restriction endonuclease McrA
MYLIVPTLISVHKEESDVWEYDHINGNSSDNRLENCQALCPNCHARKTRKIKEKNQKILQALKSIKSLFRTLK